MTRSPKAVLALLAGLGTVFVIHLLFITQAGRTSTPDDHHNLVVIPAVGAVFCLLNAGLLFGWKRTARMAALAMGAGFLAEVIGVNTGIVFGDYYYTDVLGYKRFGVPIVIGLFWFMLVFLGYVITNLIVMRQPDDTSSRGLVHDLWLAFLGALIATAYDLGLDPYMVSDAVKAWVWEPPPPAAQSYFGIPVQNYYGWIGVAFVIMYAVRWLDRRFRGDPGDAPPHHAPWVTRLIALLPVVFYASFWLQHQSHNYTPPVVVISLVALGIPAMAAISSWSRLPTKAAGP